MSEDSSTGATGRVNTSGEVGQVFQVGNVGAVHISRPAPVSGEISDLVDAIRRIIADLRESDLRSMDAGYLGQLLGEADYRLVGLSHRFDDLLRERNELLRRLDETERGNRDRTSVATIYLDDSAGAEQVEEAVVRLVESAGGSVVLRHDPVIGSWYRRLTLAFKRAADSDAGREVKAAIVQGAASRAIHSSNAQNTSVMLQNLGPVIGAIKDYRDVVIRVEALLIVKVDGVLVVHQLTPAQQLTLDRNPDLARLPSSVLPALGLSEREPSFESSVPLTASEKPAIQ
ncbi:hypothetical protein [Amycolatopsis sp. NPDC004625]|uniref:hypothetical protein n=1 Tax=Amycolatopsis sp. NPDC004625 TaxID=3154670 RepID=UPI00339F9B36